MDLIKFIPEKLLILIAATYVLGIFLKKIESVKDKYITIILMTFTIIFSMVLSGCNAIASLQGILCWGVSVGINQTAKQIIKKE
ncbi:phage holin family protein [Clostridium paraputrificum]|uniref:phage holin family protein n=1 Tax=Clostridium paraputrificum TaxID=29363 RepID=UPI003D32DA06